MNSVFNSSQMQLLYGFHNQVLQFLFQGLWIKEQGKSIFYFVLKTKFAETKVGWE